MQVRSVISHLLALAWVVLLLTRVELFQAYGKGTGVNRLGFSPVDVASYFAIQNAKLRGGEPQVRFALQCVAMPGEIYRQVQTLPSWDVSKAFSKEIWQENALKYTKETKMKKLMHPRDQVSGFAGIATLLAALASVKFPKQASVVFVLAIILMQFTLRAYEASVRIDDTFGFYALGFALVANIF